MRDSLAKHYLDDVIANFRQLKSLAERSFQQVDDREFFLAPAKESNSIAVILQHVSGNMLSRWTDFLTSDGEKPDRDRDAEFEIAPGATRAQVLERWERGWSGLIRTLEALQPEDLGRQVFIRGQAHSVIQAIHRQLRHYASHVGQVVFLAKHIRSENWKTLSIPRGQSKAFNAATKKAGRD